MMGLEEYNPVEVYNFLTYNGSVVLRKSTKITNLSHQDCPARINIVIVT